MKMKKKTSYPWRVPCWPTESFRGSGWARLPEFKGVLRISSQPPEERFRDDVCFPFPYSIYPVGRFHGRGGGPAR